MQQQDSNPTGGKLLMHVCQTNPTLLTKIISSMHDNICSMHDSTRLDRNEKKW